MGFPVLLIGVCLAVVASVISNLGLNLQKRNHLNNSNSVAAQRSGEKAATQQHQAQHQTPHSHSRHRTAAAADGRRSHRVQPSDILVKSSAASSGEAGDAAPSVRKRSGRRKKGRKGRREATGEKALLLPAGGQQRGGGSAALASYHSITDADMTDSHIAELLSASASFLVAPHAGARAQAAAASASSASFASRSSSSSSAPLPSAPAAPGHRSADDAAASINYTRQLVWQCGLALVILGSIFDFAALAFAPQSVIAPLGSLTLVSNVFLAPLLLKEKLSRRDVLCTLIIVCGAALAVGCASNGEREVTVQQMFSYFLHLQFLVYAVLVVVCVLSLRVMTWKAAVLRKRAHSSAAAARLYATGMRYHRFGYAAAAGIMGAQSVLFAKCTSTLFRSTLAGDGVMFAYWQTYCVLLGLGVTIFFQIRWLNSGLRLFPALYVVPVFQSFWILVSVVSGMVFFQEYQGVLDLPLNALGFCFGLLVTIAGVYVLSQKGGQQQLHDTTAQQQQQQQQQGAAAGGEIEVSEEPSQRRQSLSSLSSSFDASAPLHLNGEREALTAELERERSGGAEAGAAAQPLSFKQPLLDDEEKEETESGQVSITMTPARSRRRHDAATLQQQHRGDSPPQLTDAIALSPVGHAPHHLPPLPEMSSASSPRSRARGDSDPVERHHAAFHESEPQLSAASAGGSPAARGQAQLPSQSWLRPPTVEIEPVLPSHSFSHREEFLQTPPPPPLRPSPSLSGPPSGRRARSASIGHIGEEVRSFFSQSRSRGRKALSRAAKRFSISAALSSLMPSQEADAAAAAALLLGPSPHFRRPSWQQLSANAAMTAPALSAFAHAFALRNYERTDGEADGDSPRDADDDGAKQAEGEDEEEEQPEPLEAGEAEQEDAAGERSEEESEDEESGEEQASGSGQDDEAEQEEEKTHAQSARAASASPSAYKQPSPSRFAAPSPPYSSVASTTSSSLSSPLISSSSSPFPARLPLQQTHSVKRPQRR